MKHRVTALLALALGLAPWLAAPAYADLVDADGNAPGVRAAAPVLEDVQIITGSTTTSTAFEITAGGTYTVTLTDFVFPDPFESLALAITSATATLALLTEPGSFDLVIDGPMQLFALVFGVPSADSGVGLYGVSIVLAQNGGGEPVPLPAASWLLLSALAAALRLQRTRRP